MGEVPFLQRALLVLDEQQRFAVDDQKVLLVDLPVVHRHRLPGREHEQVDAELLELRVPFEVAERPTWPAVVPARFASVQHEPAVAFRYDAVRRALELRLRNHAP